MIETSGLGIGFDLTVPGIVKIYFCQLLEKLALLLLIKVLNRVDDFYYSAHGVSLLPAFRFCPPVVTLCVPLLLFQRSGPELIRFRFSINSLNCAFRLGSSLNALSKS